MLKLKGQDDMSNVANKTILPHEENRADEAWRELMDSYEPLSIKVDDKGVTDKSVENGVVKTVANTIPNESVNNATSGSVEKKDNPILSALVLIGFVAWVGALVYFSKTEPKLCISTFGAFWLLIAVTSVVGFIKDGIKDMRNVIIAFVFVYLGIGLSFVPILQMYVPTFQGQFGFRMAMYLVFIFCIILGVLLIGVEVYCIVHSKLVCTMEVSAECLKLRDKNFWRDEVDVSETQGYWHRRKKVSGVYRFEYRGQTYEVQDDTNSNVDKPMPGQRYTLYINPDNPNEFYRSTIGTHIGVFVIGVMFVLVGILCCVF